MTKRWVICDIDGTLADISHRRSFVRNGKKDWKSFLAPEQVALDAPNKPVIDVVNSLAYTGIKVVTFSGRNERLRQTTLDWFTKHGVYGVSESFFREDHDFRRDDIVKEEMFHDVRNMAGCDPLFAIDDRKQVVDMWIRLGVFVFDVAQGQGDF